MTIYHILTILAGAAVAVFLIVLRNRRERRKQHRPLFDVNTILNPPKESEAYKRAVQIKERIREKYKQSA